jgi:hypothetical protein
MQNWIILDNGSTVSLFLNNNLVQIITTAAETLHLAKIGGELITNQPATVPAYGEYWYNPNTITNTFSFAEMSKKHRITSVSENESAFVFHLADNETKFIKSNN